MRSCLRTCRKLADCLCRVCLYSCIVLSWATPSVFKAGLPSWGLPAATCRLIQGGLATVGLQPTWGAGVSAWRGCASSWHHFSSSGDAILQRCRWHCLPQQQLAPLLCLLIRAMRGCSPHCLAPVDGACTAALTQSSLPLLADPQGAACFALPGTLSQAASPLYTNPRTLPADCHKGCVRPAGHAAFNCCTDTCLLVPACELFRMPYRM